VAEIDRDLEQRIRELQRDREQVDGWVAEFGCTIAHSEYVALQARTLQLHDVPPEDPAVTKVADAWVEWTAAHWAEHEASWDTQLSDPLADSIVASRWVSTAAWDRMGELIAAGLHARALDHPALASHL
jgi:hypothetical protein